MQLEGRAKISCQIGFFEDFVGFEPRKNLLILTSDLEEATIQTETMMTRLRESARFLEVTPQKKPRNPYKNREKPAGTEKP